MHGYRSEGCYGSGRRRSQEEIDADNRRREEQRRAAEAEAERNRKVSSLEMQLRDNLYNVCNDFMDQYSKLETPMMAMQKMQEVLGKLGLR